MNVNVVCILVLFSKCVTGVNILFVDSLPSYSHYLWNKALSLALVEKGYNVTILTHSVDKQQFPKNYTTVVLEGMYEAMAEKFKVMDFVDEDDSAFNFVSMFSYFTTFVCNHDTNTKGLEVLLNYPKNFFDLIIFDVTAGQCLYPIVEYFNMPPSVAVTPFLLPPYTSFIFGNHLYPSYLPFIGARYSDRMSFCERFWNLMFVYYSTYMWNQQYNRNHNNIARKYFGGNVKTVEEIDGHFSVLLSNTDPILDYPQPLPPNIISVGGLHARPAKPLPQDLQNAIDSFENGFIVFSLGTNIKSDMLGKEKLNAILNTFKKLPYLILWKYESDNLNDIPKNVIIKKWLPINDLLGNTRMKLFVTHGGALSTQEAMYHGVPVVGIPFLVDQHMNLKKMQNRQLGETVEFSTLTEKTLYEAITKVLSDSKYTESMKETSRRFRDQPQTPLERAIFYIEYTLRNGGGRFLSPTSRGMPFYKSVNLDILAVFIVVAFAIGTILMKMFLYVCTIRKSFRKKTKTN